MTANLSGAHRPWVFVFGLLLLLFSGRLTADDEEDLLAAIADQDVTEVKRLIPKLKTLNYVYLDSETPLIVAIDQDSHELVKLLLDKGADPGFRPEGSIAPLLMAISNAQDEAIIRELVERGADLNAQWTPKEAPAGEDEFFDAFNTANALYVAALCSRVTVFEYLLSKKPDCRATYDNKTVRGGNILHALSFLRGLKEESFKEMVALGADLNAVVITQNESRGLTPISLVAGSGLADYVCYLAACGADVTVRVTHKDYNDATLAMLYLSAPRPTLRGLELLKGIGVDMKAKDRDGRTIRNYADRIRDEETCEAIIAKCQEYLAE